MAELTVIHILIGLLLLNTSQAAKSEKALISHLMNDYDKRVRPSANHSNALQVTFEVGLAQLIDVDEKNQVITTNCWITQAWTDIDLMWNPEDYNNIDKILLPYDSIWLPDILLYNSASIISSMATGSTNVIITYTGYVTWYSTVIYKSSCTIDVRYFPFDEQNCSMVFASWTYESSQLNPVFEEKEPDLDNYLPSSEFELVKMSVEKHIKYYSCCEYPFPDITYYIHLRRKPMFFVFNMLLPCFLITLVALLGFYMPSDSGEKVAMGITTLLSMTVFLMLVTEAMPPTSDSLPLIGVYYFITMGIVSLATGLTVCTLNIHHKGFQGKTIPGWIKCLCFRILAPALCLKVHLPTLPDDTATLYSNENSGRKNSTRQVSSQSERKAKLSDRLSSNSTNLHPTLESPGNQTNLPDSWLSGEVRHEHTQKEFEREFSMTLKSLADSMKKSEERVATSEHRDMIIKEWQQVALVVDRLLLVVFVLLTTGITLGLLLRGPISYALENNDNVTVF